MSASMSWATAWRRSVPLGRSGEVSWTGQLLLVAEVGDFVGVGGDEDLVELGAGAGGFVNPCKHWASGDGAKDFAGESRGGEAGGDDSEDGAVRFSAGMESSMMVSGCAAAILLRASRVLRLS